MLDVMKHVFIVTNFYVLHALKSIFSLQNKVTPLNKVLTPNGIKKKKLATTLVKFRVAVLIDHHKGICKELMRP